jgi:hypothetical protein
MGWNPSCSVEIDRRTLGNMVSEPERGVHILPPPRWVALEPDRDLLSRFGGNGGHVCKVGGALQRKAKPVSVRALAGSFMGTTGAGGSS